MTGLVRLTRLPIAAVRTGIEITVAGVGWFLGELSGSEPCSSHCAWGPSSATSCHA